MTHRNLWLNAATFGWHTGVNDRDVYLHTLPMFHCNGWGMPYALTGMGAHAHRAAQGRRRRDPAAGRRARRDPACAARPPSSPPCSTPPPTWDGRDPRSRPGAHRRRRRAAADPDDRAGRDRARLGVHPDLRPHRDRAAADHQPQPGRVGRPDAGRAGADSSSRAGRAGARRPAEGRRPTARCWPGRNVVLEGYWDQPEATAEALDDGWFHTGDGGFLDDEHYLTIADRKKDVIISGGENVSSIEVEDALFSHPAVAEVAVIGVPDEKWGETVKALVVLAARRRRRRGRHSSSTAASASPTTSARPPSSSATSWPAPPPASSRSSSCARPTGRAGTGPSADAATGPAADVPVRVVEHCSPQPRSQRRPREHRRPHRVPDLPAVRGHLRAGDRAARATRSGVSAATRRRLLERVHLPQGLDAEAPARGSRPAAHATRHGATATLHVEVTWDEAFAEVERRLLAVSRSDDRNALAIYLGNPNVHNLAGSHLHAPADPAAWAPGTCTRPAPSTRCPNTCRPG